MKVLNLYAGIGGNRKLWEDVEVTAVEINEEVAKVYQDYFPDDEVIVGDAHQYLLDHYDEFDFIWSSPPCPTHSVTNNFLHYQGHVRYPDMSLWQEIIFLKKWFYGKWVVENVKPYYEPLIIPGVEIDRHFFWSNFKISKRKHVRAFNIANARASTRNGNYDNDLSKYHGFDLDEYDLPRFDKRKMLRNCVHPEIGLHILERARGIVRKSNTEQVSLFNH